MLRNVLILLPATAILLAASQVQAAHCGCGVVEETCGCSGYVEREVMCPTWTTEKRTIMVCEYRKEQRSRTYKVTKRVPVTKEVEQTYTVMVPETRTKTVSYKVRKPVYKTIECTYTVMVPHKETRTYKRWVCKPVTTEVTRTVCEDHGCWETRTECICCVDRCGCPYTRQICKKVWVPNIVKKDIIVTVCKMQRVQKEYECCVTVCKPEERTCQVKKCEWVCVDKTVECKYTVCVPQQRTRICKVTTCKCVTEERTCNYTVCVPVQVEKEICVRVCKMVPKTIKVSCDQPCCQPQCCPKRCGILHRRRCCATTCCDAEPTCAA